MESPQSERSRWYVHEIRGHYACVYTKKKNPSSSMEHFKADSEVIRYLRESFKD